MQEEKKSIIGRLYFVRATLSKISQNKDKVDCAEMKTKKEIEKLSEYREIDLERKDLLEKRLERLKKEENDLNVTIQVRSRSTTYLNHLVDVWYEVLGIPVSIALSFLLFLWWGRSGYSFWIGLLAFSAGLVFVVFDVCAIHDISPQFYKKWEEDRKKKLSDVEEKRRKNLEEQTEVIQIIEEIKKEENTGKVFERNKKEAIKALKELKKPLTAEADQLYKVAKSVTLIDERDWKHLDVIIYVLETGRAETMKEALQQADLFVRHEEIKDVIRTSALAICQTIRQSMDDLSYSIGLRLSELQTEMARIGDAQEGISAKFDSIIDAQKLNHALLEKANVSSERLAEDVHRMRYLSDDAYYNKR